MTIRTILAAALAFASTARATPIESTTSMNSNKFMNMAYYGSWSIYAREFPISQLNTETLTHINYAYLNLYKNGTVYYGDLWADLQKPFEGDSGSASHVYEKGDHQTKAYGCVGQLYKLKQKNRHVKTTLSIGGFTRSSNFPAAASTEERRAEFARSSVKLLADWGFDGIDIVWQYPKTQDAADDYIALLKRVRQELDEYAAQHTPDYHYTLTIVAPPNPEDYQYLDMKSLGEVLDYVNLPGWYTGSWSDGTGYLSNLYPSKQNTISTPFNVADVVEAYLEGGVPSHKLILGIPIYSHSFEETDGMGEALYELSPKTTSVGPNAEFGWKLGTWEAGTWDYKDLPQAGAEEFDDDEVVGHYSYDKTKRQLAVYDTPKTVTKKVEFLHSKGLGGTMFWEATADKEGQDSLISTAFNAQGGSLEALVSENQLNYPDSVYINIAAAGKAAASVSS
ncbi:hypothetical protein BROUX41_000761 [Berkeleyomyces rouxiae]|uniref:uncharacterized protein n=1 Tax=Berkeleyomyces rouxiae TaxID=2035830 RepID=UPI003B7DC106